MPDRAISMSQPTFYVHIRDNPPRRHFGGLNDRWGINGRNKKTIFAAPFPQEGRLDERLLLIQFAEMIFCLLKLIHTVTFCLRPVASCLLPFASPPLLKEKKPIPTEKIVLLRLRIFGIKYLLICLEHIPVAS